MLLWVQLSTAGPGEKLGEVEEEYELQTPPSAGAPELDIAEFLEEDEYQIEEDPDDTDFDELANWQEPKEEVVQDLEEEPVPVVKEEALVEDGAEEVDATFLHCATLGIALENLPASPSDWRRLIRLAFKRAARVSHPDKNPQVHRRCAGMQRGRSLFARLGRGVGNSNTAVSPPDFFVSL